ncbi:hypothetical protein JCM8097_006030 [Rhodosporidiobolus ruineniae]
MVRFNKKNAIAAAATAAACASCASAQTFRRAAACPSLGCIYPPDQTEFLAGQVFDIRIEVHAPLNGTEAYNNGVPDEDFALYIRGKGAKDMQEVSQFYSIDDPKASSYNFTYYEDLFAQEANTPTLVNVLAKDYRHLTLYNPGEYELVLKYNGGMETLANWDVRPLAEKRCARNVVLFIGDGMAPSMVTAARLLGHKSVNGRYKTQLALDKAPGFGMQMTHSIDSFITGKFVLLRLHSANSATALTSGKKSTVNALNAYTDSSKKYDANPSVETVFEMGRRIYNAKVGIVSTAYLADATPASVVAHTAKRSEYDLIIDQFLSGVKGRPWTQWDGPDVLIGAGGRYFLPNSKNGNVSQIERFIEAGYTYTFDNETLQAADNSKRLFGLYSEENLPTWLDRNVAPFQENLKDFGMWNETAKDFSAPSTVEAVPGLKDLTIKALEVLHTRSKADGTPFMLMSEAASIDKAMHVGDYHRALGDLLELDNTVAATLDWLKANNLDEDTLVVVTADHGHGFDVFGSADTEFLRSQPTNSTKRDAVGTYGESGLSGYQVAQGVNPSRNFSEVIGPNGPGFPVNWTPRWTAAMGFAGDVDQYEDYSVRNSSRATSVKLEDGTYAADIEDAPEGFFISGNLPTSGDQGVHSLVDVQIFSWGPGHELFRGVLNSIDVGLNIGKALNLGRNKNATLAGGEWVKPRSK